LENLSKYSKICNLHDFVFVKSASTNKLVGKVKKKLCHGNDAAIHIQAGYELIVIPDATQSYSSLRDL